MALRRLCNATAIGKASIPSVAVVKSESVSLAIMRMLAPLVIPESDLVLEDGRVTRLLVETWRSAEEIMGIHSSQLWDIPWCSEGIRYYAVNHTKNK